MGTFFSRKTGPQYTRELFFKSEEDSAKFRAAFKNRSSYTKDVHREVKEWVADNIDQWLIDKPDWLKVEKIPDNIPGRSFVEKRSRSGKIDRSRVLPTTD